MKNKQMEYCAACILLLTAVFFFTSCDSTPPKSDKELYFLFHKDIMARCQTIDDKYKPFTMAISTGDIIEAVGIASEIQDNVRDLWSKLDAVEVPTLKDKEAEKNLKDSKDLISSAYFHKYETLTNIIEYSKQPSLYSLATIKKSSEKVQVQALFGVTSLITAGGKLGLSIDEINNEKEATKSENISLTATKLFSDAQLNGALKNIQLSGNQDNNAIKLYTVIPGIKAAQLKPTLLTAMEGVKQRYASSEWIRIGIAENEKAAESEQFIATVEYKAGDVIFTQGSQHERIELNKQIKK